MGASKIEFRLRMAINAAIIILGFAAPWIEMWRIGTRVSTLEWLALELSRTGLLRFTVASVVVIAVAVLIAACAAIMRVWGTAYLGPATVNSMSMQAGAVMADGPYRYVRNPLYLGLWLMVAAMAFLMPPTGALVSLVLLTIFVLRLIGGEEAFLSAQLGETYRAYLDAVPRIIPQLRSPLQGTGAGADWFRALLAEMTPIGVFLAFAVFSWSYDHQLMIRVILICLGISIVVRAFMPGVVGGADAVE
jgi:protein-S-isoprenylcysteine O-methyltransferase Ste14